MLHFFPEIRWVIANPVRDQGALASEIESGCSFSCLVGSMNLAEGLIKVTDLVEATAEREAQAAVILGGKARRAVNQCV